MADLESPEFGSRRDELLWLRALLKAGLVEADPQFRAALAKQYRDTLAELEQLPTPGEVDPVDELSSRRGASGGEASSPKRSEGKRGRRKTGS